MLRGTNMKDDNRLLREHFTKLTSHFGELDFISQISLLLTYWALFEH